jgi:hypothetical protein
MKIRTGFVSNSSTSSFCILGTGDEKVIKKLLKAEGLLKQADSGDLLSMGQYTGSLVTFVGSGGGADEIYLAGCAIEGDMLEEKTLSQIRQEFVESVRTHLGVDIDVKVGLRMEYGECGDG